MSGFTDSHLCKLGSKLFQNLFLVRDCTSSLNLNPHSFYNSVYYFIINLSLPLSLLLSLSSTTLIFKYT